jgi:hypothetical protein
MRMTTVEVRQISHGVVVVVQYSAAILVIYHSGEKKNV